MAIQPTFPSWTGASITAGDIIMDDGYAEDTQAPVHTCDRQDKEQLGRFFIPRSWIQSHSNAMREFMSHSVVVEAKPSWVGDMIEYTAVSPSFDLVEIGKEIPVYAVTLDGDAIVFKNSYDFIRGMGEKVKRNTSEAIADQEIKHYLKKVPDSSINGVPVGELTKQEMQAIIIKQIEEVASLENSKRELQEQANSPWYTTATITDSAITTGTVGAAGGDVNSTIDAFQAGANEAARRLEQSKEAKESVFERYKNAVAKIMP
jgi:hypothetical protein